ncbi:MAG: RNA-binding S4 domain-containing protein [Moorellaceae bacterium]
MRLDKFLKVSRLIKRRTLAKEVCEGGGAQVNGRPAKASTDIKPGDVITLILGSRRITVEVLATPEHVTAEGAKGLYRILSEDKFSSNFQA